MWWSLSAMAATWTVPGDFPGLGEALQSTSVSSGDTIQIAAGTWAPTNSMLDYDFFPNRDLTVEGVGPATVLVGLGTNAVWVSDANVTLRDLAVECDAAPTGVQVLGSGTLLLDNIDLSGCSAVGGFANNGGTLTVRDSIVHDNQNGNNGGGLLALHSTIIVENSVLSNNHAGDDGGAIYANNTSSITVSGSTFQGNTADDMGGAIRAAGPLTVTDSVFSGNVAREGGALFTQDPATLLSEVDFLNNQAELASALVTFSGGEADRVDFIGNTASMGGTIDSRNLWEFHNTFFCENVVSGASMIRNTGTIDMRNTLALDNVISSGAATFDLSTGSIDHSTFLASENSVWVVPTDAIANRSVFVDDDFPEAEFADGNQNHFFMVEPFGLDDTSGNPMYAIDRSGGCTTARGAFPTAQVVDVGPGLDADGSPLDLGHRGGALFDEDFWGPGVLDADGDGADASVDCDDGDPERYPGAPEGCNGIDNDCDGIAEVLVTLYSDTDMDGFGDAATATSTCPGPGLVSNSGDCDDTEPTVYLGADEVCDGMDNDCDSDTDEDAIDADSYWPDADGDGFAPDGSTPVLACEQPMGHAPEVGDCDDMDSDRNPGAAEACVDGIDNDCDGLVDSADPDFDPVGVNFWFDGDGDGFGISTDFIVACPGDDPPDYAPASAGEDCDDVDPDVNPGAVEVCDGIDNDCLDGPDSGLTFTPYYPDDDGDGFGAAGSTPTLSCEPVVNQVPDSTDCVDTDPDIRPGAVELCDGIDQDCDGDVDEDVVYQDYFPDVDEDGFGDASAAPINDCIAVPGHVTDNTDCDDAEPTVSPGATEIPDDGIDNDCAGGDAITEVPVDDDSDGIPSGVDPDDTSAGDVHNGQKPDPVYGVGCSTSRTRSGWIDGLRRRR